MKVCRLTDRWTRRIPPLVILLLMSRCGTIAAQSVTQHAVKGGEIYVRDWPQGLVLGTLFGGARPEHFNKHGPSTRGGWSWGYAFGSYKDFGWVPSPYLSKFGRRVNDAYRRYGHIRLNSFAVAVGTWRLSNGKATGIPTTLMAQVPLYRNFRGGHLLDPARDGNGNIRMLDKGSTVYWRYVTGRYWYYKTKDGKPRHTRCVLISTGAEDDWGFVPLGVIDFPGPHAGSPVRHNSVNHYAKVERRSHALRSFPGPILSSPPPIQPSPPNASPPPVVPPRPGPASRRIVTAETVTVRDKPGGHRIGTLRRGQSFNIERPAGGSWVYGFAYGDVNKHGYVLREWLD